MKPNFQKFLTRKYSVLMDDIIIQSWLDARRSKRLTGVEEFVEDVEIINGDFCFETNWMEKISGNYLDKDAGFFKGFCKRGYRHGEALVKMVRSIDLNADPDRLEKYFWQSVELSKDLIVFLPQTHPLAKVVENIVRKILAGKNIGDDVFEETLIAVTNPVKSNTPILEQMELHKIKMKAKNKKYDLDKALTRHLDRFAYLGYREPFARGFDLKFLKERLKDDNQAMAEKDRTRIKFGRDEKKWVELMRELVYFRNYRTEKMLEAFYYLEPLWNRIGHYYGLDKDELAHYRIDEAERLFNNGMRVKKNVIKERSRMHGFLVHGGRVKLITGPALARKMEKYGSVKTDIAEIKGSIACSGSVSGRAKIVLSSSKQDKVKVGDILVTTMTTPDFLPSMRRASAFITDEGGITCHAAIVAREMRKPCIIGTKIATNVLKDGDDLEVDANRGIVKIRK